RKSCCEFVANEPERRGAVPANFGNERSRSKLLARRKIRLLRGPRGRKKFEARFHRRRNSRTRAENRDRLLRYFSRRKIRAHHRSPRVRPQVNAARRFARSKDDAVSRH